jgi:carbon starvation protein
MFEALFILTTIDTGTRVARFLVQEFGGRIWKPFERTDWLPGTMLSTSFVVFAWAYFIWTGNISTIWPMFGTANQLLAAVALAVASSAIINAGKVKYAWVTLVPMVFVSITTLTAGWMNIFNNFLPLTRNTATATQGYINCTLTAIMMLCACIILFEAMKRWYFVLLKKQFNINGKPMNYSDPNFTLPEYGCS